MTPQRLKDWGYDQGEYADFDRTTSYPGETQTQLVIRVREITREASQRLWGDLQKVTFALHFLLNRPHGCRIANSARTDVGHNEAIMFFFWIRDASRHSEASTSTDFGFMDCSIWFTSDAARPVPHGTLCIVAEVTRLMRRVGHCLGFNLDAAMEGAAEFELKGIVYFAREIPRE